MDVQPENQILNDTLVSGEPRQAEFIPVEIVREEERRVLFTPSRWQLAVISVLGGLSIFAIAAAGLVAVVIGLLIAIPLIILRGLHAVFSRR